MLGPIGLGPPGSRERVNESAGHPEDVAQVRPLPPFSRGVCRSCYLHESGQTVLASLYEKDTEKYG
jgi:hypothetical protein